MRVLVTGLSTYWGGKLAQILENRDDVEVVVGLDTKDPTVPLERTEFVVEVGQDGLEAERRDLHRHRLVVLAAAEDVVHEEHRPDRSLFRRNEKRRHIRAAARRDRELSPLRHRAPGLPLSHWH